MQVAKWGNSLAVRLPSVVVEELNLKAGDEIEIRAESSSQFVVSQAPSREDLIERIRQLARPLPSGFKFDRQEANER